MIIAVDFDGILCEDKFPDIGAPNYKMVSFIRELIDQGHEVILWTSRINDRLTEAAEWCEDRGLHFAAVNRNAPSNLQQYGTDTRKIYADLYIDDKNPMFVSTMLEYGRMHAENRLISAIKDVILQNKKEAISHD